MKKTLYLFIILLVVACAPNLNDRTTNLVNGKNLWLKYAGNSGYKFTYKRNCFCTYRNSEIIVKVKDFKVVSAILNNKKIDTTSMQSIHELFGYILKVIKKQEREGSHSIEVEYHQQYGYPTKVEIKSNVPDSGMRILISNVVIL